MSEPIIELHDVHVRYRARSSTLWKPQHVDAVAGVSLEVRKGRTLGIVGESGSGKSTTAKVLVGLEQPTSGTVSFAGQEVTAFTAQVRKRLGRIVSVVFQDPATALNARMTVRDALVDHYLDTGELSGAITAYSPVTKKSYDMNCSDDGDVVTCRGGDNAVVHIV